MDVGLCWLSNGINATKGFNIIMYVMVTSGFFTSYGVGREETIRPSHLRFADDTLILSENS